MVDATLPFADSAAWLHRDARSGFEVVYIHNDVGGCHYEGTSTAVQDGLTWIAQYRIDIDTEGLTRRARIASRTQLGQQTVTLEHDGEGHWLVDGHPQSDLDGCLDVDLEQSALTNAFPVGRLKLAIGDAASAPAAFVPFDAHRHKAGQAVARLEQTYTRIADDDSGGARFDYTAPTFDFRSVLTYAPDGLVLNYPGIAIRAS